MVYDSYDKADVSSESYYKLAMPYKEFDVTVNITEAELVQIGVTDEVEHLGPASFPSPPFPVTGSIMGLDIRYMIPLVVQHADRPESKVVHVWFLIETGSSFTTLTKKTLEAILGPGNATDDSYRMCIQDQGKVVECHVSKDHFSEVNLLGADALRQLDLSMVVNYKMLEFQLVPCEQVNTRQLPISSDP